MRKNLRGSPFYPVNVLEGSSVKLKAQWTFSFGMISTLFARMRFVSPRLSHNHYVLLLSTGAFFRQYKIQGWEKSGFFGGDPARQLVAIYKKGVQVVRWRFQPLWIWEFWHHADDFIETWVMSLEDHSFWSY